MSIEDGVFQQVTVEISYGHSVAVGELFAHLNDEPHPCRMRHEELPELPRQPVEECE